MGGHDFKRQLTKDEASAGKADVYWECVAIAKTLTEKGFLILTCGGPGLMEAGNLGALLAGADEGLWAKSGPYSPINSSSRRSGAEPQWQHASS